MVSSAQHLREIKTWGTFEDLINLYVSDVLSMRQHLFHLEWQRLQFCDLVENLQLGEVLLVIDFMKNYNHQATDEPQSSHWDRMQSAMHPVITYYKCGCGKTVIDEMIHFTSDLKHDAYAVKEFERKMIDHLKSKNITLKCIYEYSDNCASQYKSRILFRILSKSTIPIMHNYFCEKHGKSAADGLIGWTSQFLYTAVSAKKEDLPDAASLYRFCKQHWEKNEIGACKHYERNFFLTSTFSEKGDKLQKRDIIFLV